MISRYFNHRRNFKKHCVTGKGFTLVEMLVAAAVLIIILMLIYGVFSCGLDVWETGRVQADLQAKARRALNDMVQELRNTTRRVGSIPPDLSIPALPNNDQITFYLPNDEDGNGLITDINGDIEWDLDNPIHYQLDVAQNQIVRIENAIQKTVERDVSDVEFIDIGIDPALSRNELRIILTLSKNTPKNRNVSIRLSSVVALRN